MRFRIWTTQRCAVFADKEQAIAKTEVQDIEELKSLVGQEVAVGDWLEITQERINQFADATSDHQWIHVDAERCKRESPFGPPSRTGI